MVKLVIGRVAKSGIILDMGVRICTLYRRLELDEGNWVHLRKQKLIKGRDEVGLRVKVYNTEEIVVTKAR